MVDKNFINLLDNIFGKPFMDKYKSSKNQGFTGLMATFEAKKKTFDVSDNRFALSIPACMLELYLENFRKGTGTSMKELYDEIVTDEYKRRGVKMNSGILQIPTEVLTEIFTCVVNDVIKHTTQMLNKPELKDVTRILMVGGFSDCTILRKAMDDTFGGRYTVMFPDDAWSAVLKGAVMFGHNPSAISLRIARKTYGTRGLRPFDEKIHDPAKMVVHDGVEYCDDLFLVFVKQGDAVSSDMKIRHTTRPTTASQQFSYIGIYTASSRTPKYIDEPGVEKIGSITLKRPGAGLDRPAEVAMYFGRTAIEVEARDLREGGDSVATKIDLFTR